MKKRKLRHGYTTGACAAAAAKGAALMLRAQRQVEEVEIDLPLGESARFNLCGQKFTGVSASCFVVKDAGDDPDVTNGAEIHVEVAMLEGHQSEITIVGGSGIGRVTKPGLAVPVGAWAINPVPRRMIEEGIRDAFADSSWSGSLQVTVSIPNGEELAAKTLNARLGIVGGLSILGTTGVVKPISASAWTDTIDSALDVAKACGCTSVVLSTGRTSEKIAQEHLAADGEALNGDRWREEAFIMMGDYVGHSLRSCVNKGIKRVILAGQFAKLLKIACGHEQTHVASSSLDLQLLRKWISEDSSSLRLLPHVLAANTARQVLEESAADPALVNLVAARVAAAVQQMAPTLEMKVLMAGYDGKVLYFR